VEVNAVDEQHYLELADGFLGGPRSDEVEECQRRDGATVRWNRISHEFGVLDGDRYILTYFIADPRWHGFRNNRLYFEYECRR